MRLVIVRRPPARLVGLEFQGTRARGVLHSDAELIVIDQSDSFDRKRGGDRGIVNGQEVIPVLLLPAGRKIGGTGEDDGLAIVEINDDKLVMDNLTLPTGEFRAKWLRHLILQEGEVGKHAHIAVWPDHANASARLAHAKPEDSLIGGEMA